jgi:putative phage-type endonuclease
MIPAEITDDHCEIVLVRDGSNEDEWKAARKQGISGSDALAAMGLDSRKQRAHLWREKKLELPDQENEAMVAGRFLEPAVKQLFTWHTNLPVADNDALLRSVAWPWMLATPDGFVQDEGGTWGLFEAKTTTVHLADEWADDAVPERAAAQTMHYLAVTGLPFAYVAVLINNRLQWRYMERDERLIRRIVELEEEFWELVQGDTMPDVVYGRDADDLLRELYPTATPGSSIDVTDEQAQLVENWRSCTQQAKHWATRASEAGQLVKAILGDAETLTFGDRVLATWKNQDHREFDREAFRAAHPELAEQFTINSPRRVLRAGLRKGKPE